MTIGESIKKLRENKKYTQAQVAERLNMSIGGYSNIERDETEVTITKLNQIAAILETDLATILNVESSHKYNIYNNCNTYGVNGVVHNQQIIGDKNLETVFVSIKDDIKEMKADIQKMKE